MRPYQCTLGSVSAVDTLLFSLPFREVHQYGTNSLQIMAQQEYKTGKKAGVITYKVGDDYLVREYNPHPANPRTEKQVQQRAKIKLLSQIAAIFRDIIAIFPSSQKSARSLFMACNWQFMDIQGLEAFFPFQYLSLTGSTQALAPLRKEVVASTFRDRVWISLAEEPPENVKAVFYYQFHTTDNGKLCLDAYEVSENRYNSPQHGYFPIYAHTFELIDHKFAANDYYMFALGMITKTPEAWDIWINEPYEPCELLARLIKAKYITSRDFEFTETRCLYWQRGT